jgi:hypothetical protein
MSSLFCSQPYSAEECSHLLPAQQPGGAADTPLLEILNLEEEGAPAWIPWDLALEKTAGSDLAAAYPSFSEGGDTSEEENYGLAEEDQERLLLHLLQVGAQGAGAAVAASTPGRSSGGWSSCCCIYSR